MLAQHCQPTPLPALCRGALPPPEALWEDSTKQHSWALCFVMGSVTQVFFQKNSGGSLTMVETCVMILVTTLDPCLTLGTAGSESWVAASPNLYTVSLIFALNSTHTFVFNPYIKPSLGHCYSSSNVSCWDSDGTCSYMIPHALLLFFWPMKAPSCFGLHGHPICPDLGFWG